MPDERVTFQFAGLEPQRLDKFLVECLPDYSRSRLQSLIKDGCVWVDGIPARKSGQMLEGVSQVGVLILPAQPVDLVPEAIPLDIVFENPDLLVINKPAGMVVHPAAGHSSGTLVHAVLAYAPDITGIGGELRPGIVHRLDKDTSGLILVAKNDRAHHWLQDQFRLRKVQKVYLALVDGHPPTPDGRVEVAIGRSSSNRKLMSVVPEQKGRAAVSDYRTIREYREHTLLEVCPLTGRTHQIRLHMQFIGCPVAGDTVYGHRNATIPINRHFLHATRLTFRLLDENSTSTFEAALPLELQQVLSLLDKV